MRDIKGMLGTGCLCSGGFVLCLLCMSLTEDADSKGRKIRSDVQGGWEDVGEKVVSHGSRGT